MGVSAEVAATDGTGRTLELASGRGWGAEQCCSRVPALMSPTDPTGVTHRWVVDAWRSATDRSVSSTKCRTS